MSRLRHLDIFVELIELCHERMTEVRQQLVYYRASVYKAETSQLIAAKIDRLRLCAKLFGDLMVQEAFNDYDTLGTAGIMHLAPGECSFSRRVTGLLVSLDDHLVRLGHELLSRNVEPETEAAFASEVRAHRAELLGLCREGSRQWAFFQAL